MRSLRVRTHRGQVVVTGGGVPIAMTGDEARAFARAVILSADEADPMQRDRAFGEEQTPDVPASSRHEEAATRRLAELNQRLQEARRVDDEPRVRSLCRIAEEAGYELLLFATEFTPIGKARGDTFPRIGVPVDVRAGAINLVEVDR